MLRLSKRILGCIGSAALLSGGGAFAQSGLGTRLDAQEQKLTQDEQNCRAVNLAEYARLLEEANQNRQRAEKAKKKGVPVDDAQVSADLGRAMQLFARAQSAQARQCMMQAQAAQPRPQPPPPNTTGAMNLPRWAQDILAAHNAVRAAVGAPPLEWNSVLQEHATARAGELAQIRQLVHAPREGRGTERENILSAPIGYSPRQMMNLWSKESSHFRPGLFPDVSDTGNWMDVAHYTQMIWPQTTEIGCGYAPGGGFNWLVCRYNPGGNKDGKPVIQPRLIGGDYGAPGKPVIADNSGVASTNSNTKASPPPPPTATDEAPGGNEDNHPLVGYGAEAFIRHSAAVDCGNQAAADAELAKLRYAIDELRKRLKAAKRAGQFSAVKPDDVQRQINLLESFQRAAGERKPRSACPTQSASR